MTGLNASSVQNRQQWRNELLMKNLASQEHEKKESAAAMALRNQMLTNTICCTRNDCEKVKMEQQSTDRLLRRADSAVFQQLNTTYPAAGRDASTPTKKDAKGNNTVQQQEQYSPPYCPCVVNRGGQLVTYCCVRRDCDDSTKVDYDGSIPLGSFSHFKF